MLDPIQQILNRAENEKEESDSAYFDALMYAGEMIFKFAIAGLVAAVRNDKGRHRYRQEYCLVRADGLGDWEKTLNEVLTGPCAQFLDPEVYPTQNQLLQWLPATSWQGRAVEDISEALEAVSLEPIQSNRRGVQGLNWFKAFVRLRNGARAHGAPLATVKANACIPLQNSIATIASNLHIFEVPWAYIRQNQTNKYRVSGWGATNAKLDSLGREAIYTYPNGVYVGLDDLRRVELIESNPEKTRFWIANGRFNEQRYERLCYLTNERQNVSPEKYLTPVEKLPPSETQGLGQLDVREQTHHNLPQQPSQYVHRPELERELEEKLRETDHHFTVTLTGRGGIGKTSTALKVLDTLMKSDSCPYDVMVWFSARDVDLLVGGPKEVQPHGVSVEDFADEYVRLLRPGERNLTGFEPKDYFADQLGQSDFKTLFVFDNFETTTSPLTVFRWLDTYVRGPNKVLITSRDGRFTGDYVVRVPGMAYQEAEELIHKSASFLGINNKIDETYIEKLIEESDGHPYIIKLMLGEIARADSITREPERIMASHEDALRTLFQRSYDRLSTAAQRVFLTLCRWRSSVPSLALEAVLMRPENERIDVRSAITELVQSSFIDQSTEQAAGETELSVPLAARLFGTRKLDVSVWRASIEEDMKLLQLLGPSRRRAAPNFSRRMKQLFNNIANELVGGNKNIEEFLPVLQFITSSYSPGSVLLADLVGKLGLGDESEERYLLNYLEGPEDSDFPAWEVWLKVTDIRSNRNDLKGELIALAHACSSNLIPTHILSDSANRINGILRDINVNQSIHDQITMEEKQFIIRDVVSAIERSFEDLDTGDISSATNLSRLAWLQWHVDDRASARATAERGLAIDPNNTYCKNLADRLDESF